MEYNEYIENQKHIYEEIQNLKLLESGLRPRINRGEGAYLIAFGYNEYVTEQICNLSEKVARIIPAILYAKDNIHSTIMTVEKNDNFVPNKLILEKMVRTANKFNNNFNGISSSHEKWLLDTSSIISVGIPNRQYFAKEMQIQNHFENQGINGRIAWGGHITVSRFLECASIEQTKEIISLLESYRALDKIEPISIIIGTTKMGDNCFNLTVFEKIVFKI